MVEKIDIDNDIWIYVSAYYYQGKGERKQGHREKDEGFGRYQDNLRRESMSRSTGVRTSGMLVKPETKHHILNFLFGGPMRTLQIQCQKSVGSEKLDFKELRGLRREVWCFS